jgi:hypothetical protein
MQNQFMAAGLAVLLFSSLAGVAARGQALPPIPPDRLALIGERVEALTILGGAYGVGGGAYTFRGGNSPDVSVTKLGGSGDVGPRQPLGLGDMTWNLSLGGNIGWISADAVIQQSVLAGNELGASTFGVEFGGGPRFWFNDHLSLAATISGMYGHVENTYTAKTPAGQQYEAAMIQAGWVNWKLDTWSVVPGADLQYVFMWGRTEWDINSTFTYFHTESFSSTSPVISVGGDSQTWVNKLDVDVPLGLEVFNHELHTGGFFSRTDMFGNLRTGLNSEYFYTINGRLVLDFLGRLWKVRWIGIGGSYFWGDKFDGWSLGLDMRFRF